MRTSAARLPTGNLAILLTMSLSEQMPLADVKNRVPTLHVNGGGTATREDAERDCMSAIAFALEGDPGTTTPMPKPSPST
jgi:hypothetical protein